MFCKDPNENVNRKQSQDIFENICDYLELSDVKNLSCVSQFFFQSTKNHLEKNSILNINNAHTVHTFYRNYTKIAVNCNLPSYVIQGIINRNATWLKTFTLKSYIFDIYCPNVVIPSKCQLEKFSISQDRILDFDDYYGNRYIEDELIRMLTHQKNLVELEINQICLTHNFLNTFKVSRSLRFNKCSFSQISVMRNSSFDEIVNGGIVECSFRTKKFVLMLLNAFRNVKNFDLKLNIRKTCHQGNF